MNSYFGFDFQHDHDGKQRRIAAIFCSGDAVNANSLFDKLADMMDRSIPPEQVILLGGRNLEHELVALSVDESFRAKLPAATRFSQPPVVRCLTFDHNGVVTEAHKEGEATRIDSHFIAHLSDTGLRTIFESRGGILGPSLTHHYIKPSKAHSAQFIRAANVLVSSAETNFVAFSLLPYLRDGTTHIYCDTASINAVAYALVRLRKAISPEFAFTTIESFGSYEGLKSFRFHSLNTALILISASTSGDLATQLVSFHHVLPKSIVTLFYVGEEKSKGTILIDLTKSQANPTGYDPIVNFAARKCPFCQSGSTPLEIIGDQFLTGEPKVSIHTIRRSDAPPWVSSFMFQFAGKRFVRCNYDELATDRARDLYFDLYGIFKGSREELYAAQPEFAAKFEKIVTQCLPAALCRIVHLDGRSSVEMARHVAEAFQRQVGREIAITSAKAISVFSEKNIRSEGSTLVVAAPIVSGRGLMAISQFLRKIQTNGAIGFFVALGRTRGKRVFEEIRSNICHGHYGAADYDFHCVESVVVPDDPPGKISAWQEEVDFLLAWRDHFAGDREFPTEFVEKRIRTLAEARNPEHRGLVDNVFLPTAAGSQLKLRPNIAFFDFEREFSQADVYFTICAILHSLRGVGGERGPLVQHGYHRALLSPQNFSRFNDGVIQAAILRCANREELNYKASAQASRGMKEVLNYIFTNVDNEQGEATHEFLLALAVHRLQLMTQDIEPLLEELGKRPEAPPTVKYLCRFLLS